MANALYLLCFDDFLSGCFCATITITYTTHLIHTNNPFNASKDVCAPVFHLKIN